MGNSELRVHECELFILEGLGMRIVQNTGFSDAGSSELRVHGCRQISESRVHGCGQFRIEGSEMWVVHN
jgi:hypothetical protein